MSQQKYDISLGANYDLFDDTMNNTISIGAAGGGGLWGTDITTSPGGPGTIYTTNVGSLGQTLTWNGTNPVWSTTPATPLKVNGDAEIDGDLKIKGKSLSEAIENIEKRLAILHPNEQLEEKWEELKALGERYRELEKDILEKEEIWKILKK
jgi:outer membrane lipoprotein SlyB